MLNRRHGSYLDGTVVNTNVTWNDAFYGRVNVLPTDILVRRTVTNPEATPLLSDVARATRVP